MTDCVGLRHPTLSALPLKGRGVKKEFQVIHLPDAYWPITDQNGALAELVQRIRTASSVEDQMDVVKQVSTDIIKFDNEVAENMDINYFNFAVHLYLASPSKHPAKCALSKTFNSVKHHARETSVMCMREVLRKYISTAMDIQDPMDLTSVASALIGCYENLLIGPEVLDSIVYDLLTFMKKSLDLCCLFSSSSQTPVLKVEVNKVTHTITRIIIHTLQRAGTISLKESEKGKSVLSCILKTAITLMNSPQVPLDTRTNCGFVVVLVVDCLEGLNGLIQLIAEEKNTSITDEIAILCICSGILSGLKPDQFDIVHSTRKKSVISCILDIALSVNELSIQESNLVLALWRVVQQWTRVLTSNSKLVLSLELPQVEALLNHVWGLLDHYMDSIRHLGRAILENVMHLRDSFLLIGIDVSDKMAEAVLLTPETKRSRYVILSTMTAYLNTSVIMKKMPNVIGSLLTAMQYPSMSSHVSGAFVAMATTDFGKLPYLEWYKLWILPLFEVLLKLNTSEVSALEDALSHMIKLCPTVINEVLPDVSKRIDLPKLRLILTCMKIARKLGVLPKKSGECHSLWSGILPVKIFQSALCHDCDEIRISALALVVETNRSTEIICQADLALIKIFLEYNVSCEVPAFRQQSLALVSKLLSRMRDSSHTLTRLSKQISTAKITQDYRDFIIWIVLFCFDNLRIGSNYSRRIFSLKVLTLIFDILKSDFLLTNDGCLVKMWTKTNALKLLGVILADTYEENKAMATSILVLFPTNVLDLDVNKNLFKLFQSGCVLASSIHPSECISAAYLLELCCKFYSKDCQNALKTSGSDAESLDIIDAVALLKVQLEREAKVAELDILEAASSGPMHGSLSCIRHLLQLVPDFRKLDRLSSWQKLLRDLINLCFKVNDIVTPVVNSSSPEGHLPMDFNQGSDLLKAKPAPASKVTAQMVLLCSWRTVKEVSLLLGRLSDCCPILPDKNGLLSEDQILAIGVHLTTLLEETKHRGAFEQAYVGFSLLAARLWRHQNRVLQELPKQWLNELMNAILSYDPSVSKLCATRRSAGVPFMVQALVSAEPQNGAGFQSLQCTMSQLLICAADKSRHVECRTHALNILRALYRHAPLAQHVAPHIAEGVIVAMSGFRGKTWAERNSATLLFSSLMTRIFGVRRSREELSSRNKMTGRVFFHRYPELYEFLLTELKRAVNALTLGDVAELAILHPILLLIARLYPSSLEGTDTPMQLNTFVPLVRHCASNSVLKTRVLSAKAIVPLITANVFVSYVDDLIQQIVLSCSENLAHGLALQTVYLLRNFQILTDDQLSVLIESLSSWVSKLLTRFKRMGSNPVNEVILQIIELMINSWYSFVPHSLWLIVKQNIFDVLLVNTSNDLDCQCLLGQGILEVRAARIVLQLQILEQENNLNDIILKLLRHSHYEVVLETLTVLLRVMKSQGDRGNMEAEDIIPNVLTSDRHWLENIPASVISTFCDVVCGSQNLGPVLAYLAMENASVQGRLALGTLEHVAPSVWCSNVDLEQLLSLCHSPHEGTSCAAFACFSSFLQYMVQSNNNIPQMCEYGCRLLKSYCTEDGGVTSRLVAVNFLLQHKEAMQGKYSFLSDETVSELWICAVKLICDDNSEVRSQATLLSHEDSLSVPQKSLEILFGEFVSFMKHSPSQSLATLLVLALGPLPDTCSFEADEERVFEKGETNMFIEHELLTDLVSQYISLYLLNGTPVTQWQWVWTSIGGPDDVEITDAEDLFNAIRQHNSCEFNLGSDFLVPSSIVCSLRRLNKVEYLFGKVAKLNEGFPFHYDKLFGLSVTS